MKIPFCPASLAVTVCLSAWWLPVLAEPATTAAAASAAVAPGANLVVNGDFSKVADGKPTGWAFSSAKPQIFSTTLVALPGGAHALQLLESDSVMSGYWWQSITVAPGADYCLKLQVRLDGGQMLVYVHNEDTTPTLDTRAYVQSMARHPLVPLFWKRSWIGGAEPTYAEPNNEAMRFLAEANEWTPVTLVFNTGNRSHVALSLGGFFATGNYGFKDVSLTQLPALAVKN